MGFLLDALLGLSLTACLCGLVAYQVRDRLRGVRKRPGELPPELS